MEIYQENGLYGLKNNCGAVIIAPQYREFYPFSCGLACVRNDTYQYAYINIFNDIIVPFGKYAWIDPQFKGGYARVKTADNKHWGIIDTTGKIAVIPNLDYIRPLSVSSSPIKDWGDCITIRGIYSGQSVGYVIDRMSRINLPVDFEFEGDIEDILLSNDNYPKNKSQLAELGFSHLHESENEEYTTEYEDLRLDALEGDESNYWNID